MSSPNLEDNYLSPDEYIAHNSDADDFARFTHQNGQWYFAYFQFGELILRSEGYVQKTGRDNGIESVKRYKDDNKNYRVMMQPDGQWVLTLWAANDKEIARSGRFPSEAEARLRMPSALAARKQMPLSSAHASAREDNYLACKEYANHPRIQDPRGFTNFEKDGQFYFCYVGDGDEVLLRSEGYTSPNGRLTGMQSVMRNKDDRNRYNIIEKSGSYFVILTANNLKEIARSCPKTEAEALALIDLLMGVVPRMVFASPTHEFREDNYLACKEYANHPRVQDPRGFTNFEKDGEYYFCYVGDGDEVLLRSEGYSSRDGRLNGMQSVMRNKDDRNRYNIIEKSGYYFVILTANNLKEIARSCPKTEAAALALIGLLMGVAPVVAPVVPVAAAVAAAPVVAAPIVAAATPVAAPVAAAGKSGLGWLWWLLGLLLLLALLYFLLKGCNKEDKMTASPATAIVDTPKVAAPIVDTQKVAAPAPAKVDLCGWTPVHFDYGQMGISDTARTHIQRVVDLLKSDATYTASFVGNTDDKGSVEFNTALARRRAEAVKNVAVQLGADASRITLSEKNEQDPAATNANEDGRAFNRRVVMYVYDSNKNLVCKSVEGVVPSGLK